MLKSIITGALCMAFTGVSNAMHASCSMDITVTGDDCSTVNASLVEQAAKRNGYNGSCAYYSSSTSSEVCGYTVVSGDPVHIQHETPVHDYVDDIYFTYTDDESSVGSSKHNKKRNGKWHKGKGRRLMNLKSGNCVVAASSTSEPQSLYDYDTNFCNIFNLFRDGTAESLNFDISIDYKDCAFHPSTSDNDYSAAYSQCNTY